VSQKILPRAYWTWEDALEQVVQEIGLDLTTSEGRSQLRATMPYRWAETPMLVLKALGQALGVWNDGESITHDQLVVAVARAWAHEKSYHQPAFQVGDAVRTDGDVVWSTMSNEVTVETAPNESGTVAVRQVTVSTARIPASRLRKVP
jgi:hypothetical protein